MQTKKVQTIAPKKSDAKKNKIQTDSKTKSTGKVSNRKKLNEFGDSDSL